MDYFENGFILDLILFYLQKHHNFEIKKNLIEILIGLLSG